MQMDSSDPIASLKMAFAPAIATKTPWAAVLGNHDQEGPLPREGVMKYIVGMDYTVSRVNPHGSCNKIDGFGNYNLEVFGTEGSPLEDKSVLNLYMVDSGDTPILLQYRIMDGSTRRSLLGSRSYPRSCR